MLRCITNIDMRSYITTSHQNYYILKRRATVWASRMLTTIPSNQATVGWHWLYIMKQSNKFTGWQHCTWLRKHLDHDLTILGPRLESKCCNYSQVPQNTCARMTFFQYHIFHSPKYEQRSKVMRCSGTSTLVLPSLGHKGSTPICNLPTSGRKSVWNWPTLLVREVPIVTFTGL